MKIVIDSAIPFIKNRIHGDVETVYCPGNEINAGVVKDSDALLVRTRTKCDEKLLKGTNVKLVATATIGTDHIDIPWCEKNGIVVKSSPGCNAPGVAQYVFASLFKTGFNPDKDTLGIIGYGNVGSIVGDWAHKMGIRTLINDPPKSRNGCDDVPYRSLEEVLKKSDAVTLHVPLTKDGLSPTYRLIGEKELQMMKKDSILVNSSRGGVVDEKALEKTLASDMIKSVTDVWENEPEINKRLVKAVSIATPHIAGYSAEGKTRATRMVLEAVKDVLGIPVDLTGLECIPNKGQEISKDLIEKSYNPLKDSENLKNSPELFESLRNEYPYRHEPLFSQLYNS